MLSIDNSRAHLTWPTVSVLCSFVFYTTSVRTVFLLMNKKADSNKYSVTGRLAPCVLNEVSSHSHDVHASEPFGKEIPKSCMALAY